MRPKSSNRASHAHRRGPCHSLKAVARKDWPPFANRSFKARANCCFLVHIHCPAFCPQLIVCGAQVLRSIFVSGIHPGRKLDTPKAIATTMYSLQRLRSQVGFYPSSDLMTRLVLYPTHPGYDVTRDDQTRKAMRFHMLLKVSESELQYLKPVEERTEMTPTLSLPISKFADALDFVPYTDLQSNVGCKSPFQEASYVEVQERQ